MTSRRDDQTCHLSVVAKIASNPGKSCHDKKTAVMPPLCNLSQNLIWQFWHGHTSRLPTANLKRLPFASLVRFAREKWDEVCYSHPWKVNSE